jgi:hypothetical protein
MIGLTADIEGTTMKSAYRALCHLVSLGVVLQAAFIALGTFGIFHDADNGGAFDKNTDPNFGQVAHTVTGQILIPLVAIALLIVSFFAKLPGGVKWAAIVFGLVVLQILLAFISYAAPVVGLLHGLNAFGLAAIAETAARRVGGAAPAEAKA